MSLGRARAGAPRLTYIEAAVVPRVMAQSCPFSIHPVITCLDSDGHEAAAQRVRGGTKMR